MKENLAEWQFSYLTQFLEVKPEHTVADISNGVLTLAEYLITYLEDGNYQGNIVKKMTISPDLDTSVIASNADKNPHLDVVTNMQFTVSKPVTLAWEHEVFCHLAVYDSMLCLANAGKIADKMVFSYLDQQHAPDRHINEKKSHPEVDFFYTQNQIETMCKHTGWNQVVPAPTQNHPLGRTIMVASK